MHVIFLQTRISSECQRIYGPCMIEFDAPQSNSQKYVAKFLALLLLALNSIYTDISYLSYLL